MSRKTIWSAQLLVVVLCALALKFYYSTATPDELRWILAPTTALVELLSGRSFAFESYTGYMSSDHTFVIAAPCAGVNFLITAFLMLGLRRLWRDRFQTELAFRFRWAAAIAYVATLIANTARICVALEMQRHSVEVSWLTREPIAPAGRNCGLFRVSAAVVYVDGKTSRCKSLKVVSRPAPYLLRNNTRHSDRKWFVQTRCTVLGAFGFRASAAAFALSSDCSGKQIEAVNFLLTLLWMRSMF